MTSTRKPTALAAAAVLAVASSIALAQDEPMVTAVSATHIALLNGENEIPPVTTNGQGMAFFMFDEQTNTLSWTV